MKRYDLQAGDGNLYWDEDPNGEWVKFVDAEEQSQRNLNRAIDAETELRKAKEVAKRLIEAIKSDDCSLTGSPQHWHNVKNKWDSDGSICQECVAFDELRELAK